MASFPDVENNVIDLPEETRNAKIAVLRYTCRKKMGQFLDPEVDDFNKDIGLMTNYIGLAELIGYSYQEISQISADSRGPTYALLEKWGNDTVRNPTIGSLWDHLKTLQRYDVMDECAKYIIEYGKPQNYDAFVCCNLQGEKEMEFVNRLVQELEEKRSIRLCIPDTNSLPRDAEEILFKSRCKSMIVIISKAFLSSPSHDICVRFVNSPDKKQIKIFPLLIENVAVPEILQTMVSLDFTKTELDDWSWARLYKSIK